MTVIGPLWALRVHFYRPNPKTPWWVRLLWRPKPQYAHVSIEWAGLLHELPADGVAGLYLAEKHKAEATPALTLPIPVNVDASIAADIIEQYMGRRVQKWKSALWWWGFRTRVRPRTCTTLVCSWLNGARAFSTGGWNCTSPDQLYEELVHAVANDCVTHIEPSSLAPPTP